jgi:hypothetical protein
MSKKSLITNYKFLVIGLFLIPLILLVVAIRPPQRSKPTFKKSLLGSTYTTSLPSVGMNTSLGVNSHGAVIEISRNDSTLSMKVPLSKAKLKMDQEQLVYSVPEQVVEARYQAQEKGLKEEIVLLKRPGNNQFSTELAIDNLIVKTASNGIPVFFDAKTKEYQFHLEKPYAYDAKGNVTYGVSYSLSPKKAPNTNAFEPLNVLGTKDPKATKKTLLGELLPTVENTTEYILTTTVDSDWLHNPERVYPVIIDPTIVHDTTGEFAAGTLNRIKDTGSPILESYYQELPGDTNTISLWHMNETSGSNVIDSYNKGINGTASGTTIVNGMFGKARSFDGVNDYISVPDNSNLNPYSITIESWVYLPAAPTTDDRGQIVNKGENDGYRIRINTDQTISFFDRGGTNHLKCSIMSVPLNIWTHIAVTGDDSGLKIYVNGELCASKAVPYGGPATSAPLYIGYTTYGPSYFNGIIDEVRISNVARTPEEIKASAQRRPYAVYTSDVIDLTNVASWNSLSWTEVGVGTGDGETLSNSTGLVAQWNFNETSGTTAANNAGSCGSACNGTLTNFASTGSQDAAAGSGWTANNKRWGNGALMFDGTDDYVTIPDHAALDITGSMTIEFWVKIDRISGDWTRILTKGEGLAAETPYLINIHDYGSGDRKMACNFSGTGTATPITTGQWYYIACTGGPSGVFLYVNGELASSNASAPSIITNNENVVIGKWRDAYDENFQGTLDSFRIYNRALSYAEILANYNIGNIELQTRVGTDSSPDDGSWEEWRPVTSETQILSMDSDSANWSWDKTIDVDPLSKADSTLPKVEGTGSTKLNIGQYQTDANTLVLLHLDETTCSAGACLFDSSGNNYHASPTGEVTVAEGPYGRNRYFDGNGDYLDIPAAFTPSQITLEAWVRPHVVNGQNRTIISRQRRASDGGGPYGAAWILSLNSSNKFSFSMFDGSTWRHAVSTTTPKPYQWYHVTGSYNGSHLRIFVNGVIEATFAYSGGINYGGTPYRGIKVGAGEVADAGFGAGEFFIGNIDEVRIRNSGDVLITAHRGFRSGRDHYLTRAISSTNFSNKTTLPFWIASDRTGTFLQAILGESDFANYQPDGNTVALWHLDEVAGAGGVGPNNAGWFRDATGNTNNNGTAIGTSLAEGKIGKGRNFNGSSDYINTGTGLNSITSLPVTIEAWIKPNATSAVTIFQQNDSASRYYGFRLGFGSNNDVEVAYGDGTGGGSANRRSKYSPANILSAGNWYHLVGVIRGPTDMDIYVNGVNVGGHYGGSGGNMAVTSTNGYIGRGVFPSITYYFNGIIDEVRVSNSARTANEIRQAYEIGLRSHPITIDFKAKLDASNLITSSTDYSFTINSTAYGAGNKGDNLYVGDKIIIKERTNTSTEYIAQGTVTSVNKSTGAVTVSSWDTGSTVPQGGYTTNAVVFKWQREYFNIKGSLNTHLDAINRITLRITDGSSGANVWIDDFKSGGPYLTNPLGSTITSSTGNRYFQYRAILSSNDAAVSPSLTSVTLDYESNQEPTAPTTPWCEGQTNPIGVSDLTPEFSAVYSDPDGNPSAYYQIQVNATPDFSGKFLWDSGQTGIGVTSGNRSPEISYNGSDLSYNGATFYWRIKFWDSLGAEGPWSETQQFTMRGNNASDATTPYCEQTTNPTNVTDLNPEFSAVHTDPDGDAATHYEIEVNTSPDFNGTSMWDTGKTPIGSSLPSGSRLPDKDYAGTALSHYGATYYWRIRFWDEYDVIGNWSATQNFTMTNLVPPTSCVLIKNPDNTQITVRWTDTNSIEEGYQIDKKTDGTWSTTPYHTTAADATSYLDTTNISSGHTYQYRVRAKQGVAYSDWCYTPVDNLQEGSFKFEGLKREGIKLQEGSFKFEGLKMEGIKID